MMFQMSKGEHQVLIMTWKMICQTLQAKKGRAKRIKKCFSCFIENKAAVNMEYLSI